MKNYTFCPSSELQQSSWMPINRKRQQGASLIMVLIVLTVVSLLGVAGIQISMMSERGARNDRDQQIAWQAAEAALLDAQFDLDDVTTASPRYNIGRFPLIPADETPDMTGFTGATCNSAGIYVGLCPKSLTPKAAWLNVDFTTTGVGAQSAAFGQFTGRLFPSGQTGPRSFQPPRYVVELIDDKYTGSNSKYAYRITAMGFGPKQDIQAVVQSIYRPER